jgi:hypothetical protein
MNFKESLITEFYNEIKKELREELKKEFEEKFNNTIVKITNLQNELNEVKQQLQYTIEKRNEIFYQKHLEKLLNGTHKTTKHGITDIFTKDAIYEIKGWKNYKSCFGQLKSYYVGNEDKRLCAAFYGEINEEQKQKITELFSQNKIEVYEITESYDGVISLKHLNEFIKENDEQESCKNDGCENDICKDNFEKWLDKNIEYKEGGILKLNEVCEMYLSKKVAFRSTSKFKKEIEKYIKSKYPKEDYLYTNSSYNNIKFKGWLHLCLKQ